MNQAFRVADILDVRKAPYGIATYPYIFRSFPAQIRIEMGTDNDDNRIVATINFVENRNKPGATGHIAVWIVDEKTSKVLNLDPEFCSVISENSAYYSEAFKHVRGALLKLDLGLSNGYLVSIHEIPPPPDEEEELRGAV